MVVRAADGGPSVGSSSQVSPRPIDLDWDGLESLRAREYGRLDALGETYLDYTGGGLYAESQLHAHRELLAGGLFGNPHSSSPASRSSTELADAARRAILAFVNASPDEYTVVFTANASAALKLVGEAFPFAPGSRYLMTTDNHNSVNGIRLFAEARGAEVTYLPLRVPDLRQDADEVLAALDRAPAGRRHLFAYPAQSNYSGVRHPLDWVAHAQARGWDVLLDAAAFLPTNRLDLSRVRPDFVTVSWYKVFGYPTGLGSLIVRREALARLRRPWFGGRDDRGRIRHRAAEHLGRRRDGLRGRHDRLPGRARPRDRARSRGGGGHRRDPRPRAVPDPVPAGAAADPASSEWGAAGPALRAGRRRRSRRHDPLQRARPGRAASSTSGRSRRWPRRGGSPSGPAASATRARVRRPAA